MEQLFHVIIENPPTKYVQKNVKIKLDKIGKVIPETVYYLTGNLFYGNNVHWATVNKIVSKSKGWVIKHLQDVPKMEKCRIEITYHYPTDNFDLDNKVYYWCKIILDALKTPTSKQVIKAENYGNPIKTVEALPEDTVRYVDKITMEYKKGSPALEIKIFGRKAEIQQNLF